MFFVNFCAQSLQSTNKPTTSLIYFYIHDRNKVEQWTKIKIFIKPFAVQVSSPSLLRGLMNLYIYICSPTAQTMSDLHVAPDPLVPKTEQKTTTTTENTPRLENDAKDLITIDHFL